MLAVDARSCGVRAPTSWHAIAFRLAEGAVGALAALRSAAASRSRASPTGTSSLRSSSSASASTISSRSSSPPPARVQRSPTPGSSSARSASSGWPQPARSMSATKRSIGSARPRQGWLFATAAARYAAGTARPMTSSTTAEQDVSPRRPLALLLWTGLAGLQIVSAFALADTDRVERGAADLRVVDRGGGLAALRGADRVDVRDRVRIPRARGRRSACGTSSGGSSGTRAVSCSSRSSWPLRSSRSCTQVRSRASRRRSGARTPSRRSSSTRCSSSPGALRRGALLPRPRRDVPSSLFGTAVAVVGTAVAFGLAHGILVALPPLVVLRARSRVGALRTDSVWPGFIAHAAYNAVGIALAVATSV